MSVFPILAPEMVRARVEQLRSEARAGAGRPAEHRRVSGAPPGWRLSLGLRLVSAGFRLLGESAEVR